MGREGGRKEDCCGTTRADGTCRMRGEDKTGGLLRMCDAMVFIEKLMLQFHFTFTTSSCVGMNLLEAHMLLYFVCIFCCLSMCCR